MGMKPRRSPALTPYQRLAIPALEDSIAHWKRLASGTHGFDETVEGVDCACCAVWFDTFEVYGEVCGTCPLRIRSGAGECVDTPYRAAANEWYRQDLGTIRDPHAMPAMVTYLQETLEMVKSGEVAP